jgi:hypothetical protein
MECLRGLQTPHPSKRPPLLQNWTTALRNQRKGSPVIVTCSLLAVGVLQTADGISLPCLLGCLHDHACLIYLQVRRQSAYSVSSSSCSSSSSEGGDLEGGGLGFSGDLELELPDMSSEVPSHKAPEAAGPLPPLRCGGHDNQGRCGHKWWGCVAYCYDQQ